MQQSTYVSLNTQAMKLKLNSGTLKAKTDSLINDLKEVLDNFKVQEHNIKQLDAHDNKSSRDFYSLVNTAERNLSDIHRKNEELAKKLTKIEAAAAKIDDLKEKLTEKYVAGIASIKPEDQRANLYDFTEYNDCLQKQNNNCDYVREHIAETKYSIETNNVYFDNLQIILSSFNIDKLKKDTTHNIEKVTKNIEALCSIYPNTSAESKEEIAKFLPQLELNIKNLNQKSEVLFAFGKAKDIISLAEMIAVASNDEHDNRENSVLKFG
jgi:hypothetical protein